MLTPLICASHRRSVFDDALPMLGTGGGVGVMRDLMTQEPNNILTNTWLTSLSFIPRCVVRGRGGEGGMFLAILS